MERHRLAFVDVQVNSFRRTPLVYSVDGQLESDGRGSFVDFAENLEVVSIQLITYLCIEILQNVIDEQY